MGVLQGNQAITSNGIKFKLLMWLLFTFHHVLVWLMTWKPQGPGTWLTSVRVILQHLYQQDKSSEGAERPEWRSLQTFWMRENVQSVHDAPGHHTVQNGICTSGWVKLFWWELFWGLVPDDVFWWSNFEFPFCTSCLFEVSVCWCGEQTEELFPSPAMKRAKPETQIRLNRFPFENLVWLSFHCTNILKALGIGVKGATITVPLDGPTGGPDSN